MGDQARVLEVDHGVEGGVDVEGGAVHAHGEALADEFLHGDVLVLAIDAEGSEARFVVFDKIFKLLHRLAKFDGVIRELSRGDWEPNLAGIARA